MHEISKIGLSKVNPNATYILFLPGVPHTVINSIIERLRNDPNMPKVYVFDFPKENMVELNNANIDTFIKLLSDEKKRRNRKNNNG